MLDSATEHYQRQQRITAAAVVALRREKRLDAALRAVAAFQLLAARDAAESVPLMLEEQSIDTSAAGEVVVASVAGVSNDGRPLDGVMELREAKSSTWGDMLVASLVQDAARQAAGLGIAVRPQVSGWIRMMNPPSCSRCAVLAGKWFRWNQGFQRHPRCDCRHIPSQEADYSDERLSGDKWFHTLDPAEQDRIFTKSGAQAVRDGADLNQVVNARRGMDTVAYGNKTAVITREGVTKRGLYGSSQTEFVAASRAPRGAVESYAVRRASRPRVMPETIYEVAPNRDEAIRLLKLNGFII